MSYLTFFTHVSHDKVYTKWCIWGNIPLIYMLCKWCIYTLMYMSYLSLQSIPLTCQKDFRSETYSADCCPALVERFATGSTTHWWRLPGSELSPLLPVSYVMYNWSLYLLNYLSRKCWGVIVDFPHSVSIRRHKT